jgi:hypothetical protein
VWVGDLISMASTCYQPIIHSYPHAFTVESGFQSSKPPTSSDTSRLGYATRFNLSVMDLPVSMNGRFQVPAAGQLLPSARTTDLSKDREIFDSDDDDDNDLPSVKQILASSKRPKQVIDLTGDDDDDDREGDDGDFIEVSRLRTTRTARQLVRLILPSLIDRIQVADQLRSPFTALSGTHRRRPHTVVYSGHTW